MSENGMARDPMMSPQGLSAIKLQISWKRLELVGNVIPWSKARRSATTTSSVPIYER